LAPNPMPAIDAVVKLLEQSRSLLFITGAGVSADSGLPTYRGIGGLYTVNCTEDGLAIEDVLSGWSMRQRPELTWKYLGQIERACRGARCNRAHEVMAEMQHCFDRVWVLTQNVDGFHRQAGSRNVIDIHGDLHRLYCPRCGFRQEVADYDELAIPPRCPGCAGNLRPDVVLFGEMLPLDKVALLEQELVQGFDLTFSIGTTSIFPYVAGPVHQAKKQGRPTVEINPGTTDVSHLVDIRLAMGAARALEEIWCRYRQRHENQSSDSRNSSGNSESSLQGQHN
jgi:NAD-dependent deacetylase